MSHCCNHYSLLCFHPFIPLKNIHRRTGLSLYGRYIRTLTLLYWFFDLNKLYYYPFQSADDRSDAEKKSNEMITVKHDGTNIWRSPGIYNSMCVLDVKYFPFDEQLCELVFASWTRDGSTLELILDDSTVTRSGKDTKFFQENEEWRVLYAKIKREEVSKKHSRLVFD